MQPVHRLGAGPAELVTPVHQHPHHHQVIVDLNPQQVGRAERGHCHRVRVHQVALAAVAGGEHPHLADSFTRLISRTDPNTPVTQDAC
jgi:hypothetical protein